MQEEERRKHRKRQTGRKERRKEKWTDTRRGVREREEGRQGWRRAFGRSYHRKWGMDSFGTAATKKSPRGRRGKRERGSVCRSERKTDRQLQMDKEKHKKKRGHR